MMQQQAYSLRVLPFMQPSGPHMPVSEGYVCCPPALVIRDGEGALWTLGFDMGSSWRTGEFEYDVVRCGPEPDAKLLKTGDHACRIEYRRGQVRIFGEAGWRTWNGRTFV